MTTNGLVFASCWLPQDQMKATVVSNMVEAPGCTVTAVVKATFKDHRIIVVAIKLD